MQQKAYRPLALPGRAVEIPVAEREIFQRFVPRGFQLPNQFRGRLPFLRPQRVLRTERVEVGGVVAFPGRRVHTLIVEWVHDSVNPRLVARARAVADAHASGKRSRRQEVAPQCPAPTRLLTCSLPLLFEATRLPSSSMRRTWTRRRCRLWLPGQTCRRRRSCYRQAARRPITGSVSSLRGASCPLQAIRRSEVRMRRLRQAVCGSHGRLVQECGCRARSTRCRRRGS